MWPDWSAETWTAIGAVATVVSTAYALWARRRRRGPLALRVDIFAQPKQPPIESSRHVVFINLHCGPEFTVTVHVTNLGERLIVLGGLEAVQRTRFQRILGRPGQILFKANDQQEQFSVRVAPDDTQPLSFGRKLYDWSNVTDVRVVDSTGHRWWVPGSEMRKLTASWGATGFGEVEID